MANNGFCFFCFYLYLFNVPNSIHFDYLATLWMVLNWYPGVVKSLRLRKIICTVVLISETLRKKYWIWTECWWVNVKRKSEIKMTSATVCISQSLTSNHFIIRSHLLQSFRLSLQPFTRPFLMEHQNEDFFFLSVSPPPISPSVASSPSCLYFFSLSLSFSLLS